MMQPLFHMCGTGTMNALPRHCSNMFTKAFAALMLVALSSCGGSGSPSVSLGNMVPVRIAMHMAGQPLAQVDQNMIDKILDLAIPDANAVINLAGFKSAKITISGNGFTPIVRSFNAVPGTLVTQSFQVPQGTGISFNVQGFNTSLGVVAAPVPVVSGTTVQAIAPSVAPVVVNVTLKPTVVVPAPPAPVAPAIATTPNVAGTTQVTPNDPNFGNTHTYAVTTPAANGTVTVSNAGANPGLATYTPNAGFAGTDSFVVTVTDQGGLTGTVTIAVAVNAPAGQTFTVTVKDVLTAQPVAGLVVNLGALTATTSATGVAVFSVSPGTVTITTSHASYVARSYPYLLRNASTALRIFVYPVSAGATDGDGDGLPDAVESNTGIFLSALSTGSNPAVADTDADGIDDGTEVLR